MIFMFVLNFPGRDSGRNLQAERLERMSPEQERRLHLRERKRVGDLERVSPEQERRATVRSTAPKGQRTGCAL